MQRTKIEWAEYTWNPVTGCTKVSPGCAHCYAERMHERFLGPFNKVKMHSERLEEPLRVRKPSKIFVCSMGDLFHESVSDKFIAQVFNVMASRTANCGKRHQHEEECWSGDFHTYMVLTKRPERMKQVMDDMPEIAERYLHHEDTLNIADWPLSNIWLGVSAENQHLADKRIPDLLETPATIRWLSAEPLLGPIDLSPWLVGLYWVVVGGETGPGARPMNPDWARSIRDQCQAAGVPFFMKQMSGRQPIPADLLIREWPR